MSTRVDGSKSVDLLEDIIFQSLCLKNVLENLARYAGDRGDHGICAFVIQANKAASSILKDAQTLCEQDEAYGIIGSWGNENGGRDKDKVG